MKKTAISYMSGMIWACQEDYLKKMCSIAERTHEIPENGIHNRALDTLGGMRYGDSHIAETFGSTGVVHITGPIFRYAGLFTEISGATAIGRVAKVFSEMQQDESIEHIILNIDSPGGEVTGISEFAQRVRNSTKPVTAYVDGMAASAAYWIASAAGKIVMNDTSSVGSIGVVITVYRSDKDEEYTEFVSSQSPMKRPDYDSEEGKSEIQSRADQLAAVFVATVAENRSTTVENVLINFGKGGIKIGEQAVSAGMADEIGNFEDLINNEEKRMSDKSLDIKGAPTTTTPRVLTVDSVKTDHPDIFAAIFAEGVRAENDRVKSVQAQSFPGHEKLIAEMIADGKTTGSEAAIKILAAEREGKKNTIANLAVDLPKHVEPQFDDLEDDSAKTGEELWKAEWDSSVSLRDEFSGEFSTYMSYKRAEESGKIKMRKGE